MRRFITVVILTGCLLAPLAVKGDPAQPTTSPPTNAEPAPPSSSSESAPRAAPTNVAPDTRAGRETVVVTGRAPSENLDAIICKSQPATTGTRLGATHECHTEREWERRRKESQDITRKAQAIGETGFIPDSPMRPGGGPVH